MSTRLTTGLLSCLMASCFLGCAASPESLIRGQSPAAYPMPAGTYSGHQFGANSQGVPRLYSGHFGQALQSHVHGRVDAYYGTEGSQGFGAGGFHGGGLHGGGFPVSSSYTTAYGGGGAYHSAACENGATCENDYCEDPYCHKGHCKHGKGFGNCLQCGRRCPDCNGRGCPHCKGSGLHGSGLHGGGQWVPTHLYQHMYKIPQGMVYPQNPTPGAITVYPYYTHKGPDDFFHPPLDR